MSKPQLAVDWGKVETVLLDMDGTVLDLAFANHFWLEVVPGAYGAVRGLALEHAHQEIRRRYERVAGRLSWYCVDHWSEELGLDIRALKLAERHRIGYLP